MRNIRFKNANVFKLVYDLYGTDYVSASTTASASSFTGRDYYAYLNKYLNNDDMYTAVSAYSGDLEYVLFRRSDGSFSGDPRVLTLSYTGASVGFSATQSSTGKTLGYEYLLGSSGDFVGWMFPNQRSFIVSNTYGLSTTASLSEQVSYYMSESSYYLKVQDHEMNNSYNCVTAAAHDSYTASEFIKGKPTYVTSIGLYDDDNNCLAVAKLSKPVQKLQFIPMCFKVRFFN